MKGICTLLGVVGLGLGVVGIVLYVQGPYEESKGLTPYRHRAIDSRYPFGHISAQDAGDIDGDRYPDIVIRSGKSGEAEIAWYRNPLGKDRNGDREWTKYRIASDAYPSGNRSSGSALLVFDVNRDGRPDVITGAKVKDIGNGLFWWEAPEDPRTGDWRRHLIAAPASVTGEEFAPHDMRLADIDQDGRADLVIGGSSNQGVYWARIPMAPSQATNWELLRIGSPRGSSYAGLAVGDINGDGRPDVVHADVWYQSSDPLSQPEWRAYAYGAINIPPSNVELYDMDRDGKLDIVVSSGHSGEYGQVVWYKAVGGPESLWTPMAISSQSLAGPESLLVLAGPPENSPHIVTAEMDFLGVSEQRRMFLYSPAGPELTVWQEIILHTGKNFRSLKAVDLDRDGDLDLSAISFTEPDGYAHVDWFENTGEFLHEKPGARTSD